MKHLLLLLLLLLAPSAYADDAVRGFQWSSLTNTFHTILGGTDKQVPDYEKGTFTASFTGPRTATETVTYTRTGRTVTLTIGSDASGTCTAASNFSSPSGTMPVSIRPAANSYNFAIFVRDASADQAIPGYFAIGPGGNMSIGKTQTGAFTGSGTCGFYSFGATYNLD